MSRAAFARVVAGIGGLNYVLSGAGLLFAPQWFYEHVGRFAPFNRHYAGDLGAFLLPLGVGLLWAARDPARHARLIGVAAAASALHALNHLYDDWAARALTPQFFSSTLPLLVLAALLVAAYFLLPRPGRTAA